MRNIWLLFITAYINLFISHNDLPEYFNSTLKDAKGIKLNDVNKERNVDALCEDSFALAAAWQHFLK